MTRHTCLWWQRRRWPAHKLATVCRRCEQESYATLTAWLPEKPTPNEIGRLF